MSAPPPTFARRRVQTGEVALQVAVAGDDPPVVLLHDGAITAEALAAYRTAFADPRIHPRDLRGPPGGRDHRRRPRQRRPRPGQADHRAGAAAVGPAGGLSATAPPADARQETSYALVWFEARTFLLARKDTIIAEVLRADTAAF